MVLGHIASKVVRCEEPSKPVHVDSVPFFVSKISSNLKCGKSELVKCRRDKGHLNTLRQAETPIEALDSVEAPPGLLSGRYAAHEIGRHRSVSFGVLSDWKGTSEQRVRPNEELLCYDSNELV